MTLRFRIELAADAVMVKGHDLTRLDITDIFRSYDIKGTGLAGNHITFSKLTDRQRMETIFVAACIKSASCHYDKGKGAVYHIKGILDCIYTGKMLVSTLLLDKVGKNLRI